MRPQSGRIKPKQYTYTDEDTRYQAPDFLHNNLIFPSCVKIYLGIYLKKAW